MTKVSNSVSGLNSTCPTTLSEEELTAECAFVESISHEYPDISSPYSRASKRAAMKVISAMLPPNPSVLELGCADGYMTSLLAGIAKRHVVVDGSVAFIKEARSRAPEHVVFHNSLFETNRPSEQFDLVVLSFVLEHVLDPVAIVSRARDWIKRKSGRIFVAVPNMRALSRQLARAMGILHELDDLTPNDLAHGHRRCYDRISLDRDLEKAGAEILVRGGLIVKPLAHFQMDKMIETGIIGAKQLEGLERLGMEYADFCGCIYAVCR